MNNVKLVWITPEAEKLIAYIARVSNPANQDNHDTANKLIKYCIENKHWSPFEMASACFEINTTRDIGRQILRHRAFHYQEFSQRYQSIDKLPEPELREARLQDTKNRQNSLETDDANLILQWELMQKQALKHTEAAYKWALDAGVAKEQARAVLPEGLTMSRMYMQGTIRDWIHYCQVRCDASTQKEHRQIAFAISDILQQEVPAVWASAMFDYFTD